VRKESALTHVRPFGESPDRHALEPDLARKRQRFAEDVLSGRLTFAHSH
jgi:hypothetical protein